MIHQLCALNYNILLVSRHQNRLDKLLEAPGKHFTRRRIGLLVGHIPSQFVWSQSTFVAPWENNFETVRSSQTHLVQGWTISLSGQPHHKLRQRLQDIHPQCLQRIISLRYLLKHWLPELPNIGPNKKSCHSAGAPRKENVQSTGNQGWLHVFSGQVISRLCSKGTSALRELDQSAALLKPKEHPSVPHSKEQKQIHKFFSI
jgi:hypothetical protein